MLAHTLHLRDVPATLDDGQIVADRDVNGPQESFTFDDRAGQHVDRSEL